MTTITETKEGLFCWIDMGAPDMDSARSFYRAVFDWNFSDPGPAEMRYYSMIQSGGGVVGGFYQAEEESSTPAQWMPYILTEVDACASKVVEAGGILVKEPFDVGPAGRMALVADPTGAQFALWQWSGEATPTLRGEANSVGWNELLTSEPATAAAFYTTVFGWTTVTHDMPTGPYTEFKIGEQSVGGMLKNPDQCEGVASHWLTYFAVEDCDAKVAVAAQAGATVAVDPTDIPKVGRFSVMTDPQGTTFAVIKFAPTE